MSDRPVISIAERAGKLVHPLDLEPVGDERRVLGPEVGALARVSSEPEAADPRESVAGQFLEPIESALG